jgi:hypothetical protein
VFGLSCAEWHSLSNGCTVCTPPWGRPKIVARSAGVYAPQGGTGRQRRPPSPCFLRLARAHSMSADVSSVSSRLATYQRPCYPELRATESSRRRLCIITGGHRCTRGLSQEQRQQACPPLSSSRPDLCPARRDLPLLHCLASRPLRPQSARCSPPLSCSPPRPPSDMPPPPPCAPFP